MSKPSFVDWMFHYSVTTGKWGKPNRYRGSYVAEHGDYSRITIDLIQTDVRNFELRQVEDAQALFSYFSKCHEFHDAGIAKACCDRVWAEYERATAQRDLL